MTILELIRLEDSPVYGTFGTLKINKETFCVTLEPPDLLNRVSVSSIPAKQYVCRRIISPRYGLTFQVLDVPGRTAILFHGGNTIMDTQGCILLGQYYGKLHVPTERRAVLNSGRTFGQFMERLAGVDEAHLTIRECY
jgi:hypothetical protein